MIPSNLVTVGYQAITDGQIVLWCATARNLLQGAAVASHYILPNATRNSQTVFWRGVKEKVEITTSDVSPWFWRRICFEMKGQFLAASIPASQYINTTLPGAGREQIAYNRSTTPLTAPQAAVLRNYLFEGMNQVDYFKSTSAPIDKYRIKVVFDHTWTINSGSGGGVVRKRNLWHGMNHNMMYNDQEFGGDIVENNFFAVPDSLRGMGDYYICDIFETAPGFSGTLNFLPEAIAYWHER